MKRNNMIAVMKDNLVYYRDKTIKGKLTNFESQNF